MSKPGNVFIMCPAHSRSSSMISATLRPYGKDIVAICPFCIQDLRRLEQDRALAELKLRAPAPHRVSSELSSM